MFENEFVATKKRFRSVFMNKDKKVFEVPKGSAFKFKTFGDKGGFFIDNISHTPKLTGICKIDNDVFGANTENGTMIKINTKFGKVTPEFIIDKGNYIVSTNGDVLKLINNCIVEKTNLKCPKINGVFEINSLTHNEMIFENENGKFVICDRDLKQVVPFEFESDNIKFLSNIYLDQMNVKVYEYDNQILAVDENNNLVLHTNLDGRDVSVSTENIVLFDKEKNVSEIYSYSSQTNKYTNEYTVNGNVVYKYTVNDKPLFLIEDANSKYGLVNSDNKIIIPNAYKNINLKKVGSHDVFEVETDDKKFGVFNPDGKKLLEPNYREISFSDSVFFNEKFKFLAKDNNCLYGIVGEGDKIEEDFKYEFTQKCYIDNRLQVTNKKTNKKEYITLSSDEMVTDKVKVVEQFEDNTKKSKIITKSIKDKTNEDDRILAGVLASVVMGSPIAGLYVYGMTEKDDLTM